MKFMVTWDIHPDKRLDVIKAWVSLGKKGRADVGKGLKLIGRWHNSAEGTGVAIMQANDIKDLFRYLGRWNTMMDLSVTPVLTDEESAGVARGVLADLKS